MPKDNLSNKEFAEALAVLIQFGVENEDTGIDKDLAKEVGLALGAIDYGVPVTKQEAGEAFIDVLEGIADITPTKVDNHIVGGIQWIADLFNGDSQLFHKIKAKIKARQARRRGY